jgi:predicted nucleotidyltransferase component of viral defense system
MNVARLAVVLAREMGGRDVELVERDIRLHLLLREMSRFSSADELIFKGGTCLAKCYLHYHRFSADLDFNWRDQTSWAASSKKGAREALRRVQRPLEAEFKAASDRLGLTFAAPASVRYGRSNRMVTMAAGYRGVAGTPTSLKVQISFEDIAVRKPHRASAVNSFGGPLPMAARIAEPAVVEGYKAPVDLLAMDAAEIAAEKVRAILTRQAAKGRDILDLYLLEKELGINVRHLEAEARAKTAFSLEAAARHREHIGNLDARLEAMAVEDLRPMMLRPVSESNLRAYRERLVPFLVEIAKTLKIPGSA